MAQREADVVEQHRVLDLDRDVVRDDRRRTLVVVLVEAHAVEQELVPADGEHVARGERRPRHPAAVVVQAVAAVQVDEQELGAGPTDFRVLPGHPEVGQHDVVVVIASDPDRAGRVERGHGRERHGGAAARSCQLVFHGHHHAGRVEPASAGPNGGFPPVPSGTAPAGFGRSRPGVRKLPRLEKPERGVRVWATAGTGVGEQLAQAGPGGDHHQPVGTAQRSAAGRPPQHLVRRAHGQQPRLVRPVHHGHGLVLEQRSLSDRQFGEQDHATADRDGRQHLASDHRGRERGCREIGHTARNCDAERPPHPIGELAVEEPDHHPKVGPGGQAEQCGLEVGHVIGGDDDQCAGGLHRRPFEGFASERRRR